MEQSPKAQRPHAPGEHPSDDGNPYHEIEERVRQQGPKGDGRPTVPKLDFGPARSQGGVESGEAPHPVSSAYDAPAGSPGYVDRSDSDYSDSTEEQFGNSRGGNS